MIFDDLIKNAQEEMAKADDMLRESRLQKLTHSYKFSGYPPEKELNKNLLLLEDECFS